MAQEKYKDPKQPVGARVKDLLARMVQIDRSVASAQVMRDYFIGSVLSGGGSIPLPQATPSDWVTLQWLMNSRMDHYLPVLGWDPNDIWD
nr:lysosomal beta glucosidase isoform X2 [Ipomoea batatas]